MKKFLSVILLGSALFAGCGPREEEAPKIREGRDSCSHCRMIISDLRAAASAVDGEGRVYKYDDIGCMRLHEKENSFTPRAAWVYDRNSGMPLDRKNAVFVNSDNTPTPMGYGISAFSVSGEAQAFADGAGGQIIFWEAIPGVLEQKMGRYLKGGN